MKNIKFVVKVNRGSLVPAFVQRIDRTPVQMTTNRKLALMMGKIRGGRYHQIHSEL